MKPKTCSVAKPTRASAERTRERCSGAASRNTQRSENGSGFRVAVTQARDHVVQQPPPKLKQTSEPLRVAIDLHAADALNHADARDRVKALTGELAGIHHADLDPAGDARPRRPVLREARLGLGQRDPDHLSAASGSTVDREAAQAAADVQQARSPGPSASLSQTNSRFARGPPPASSRRAGIERHARCSCGRPAEEGREELMGDVVVMAHSARVTDGTVTPAARAQPAAGTRGPVASAHTRTPPQARAGP